MQLAEDRPTKNLPWQLSDFKGDRKLVLCAATVHGPHSIQISLTPSKAPNFKCREVKLRWLLWAFQWDRPHFLQ